jgi:hypothetical protein
MIDRFTVRGFKSLEDVEVDLGRLNVFIGPNGSGKSNFLEAIGVLGAAASGRVNDESLQRRGVRLGIPALYESSFRGQRPLSAVYLEAFVQDPDRYTLESFAKGRPELADPSEESTISLEADTRYAVTLLNPTKDPAPAWRYETELLAEGGNKICDRSSGRQNQDLADRGFAAVKILEIPSGKRPAKLLDALQQYTIYSPSTGTLRGLNQDLQQREPVGLSGGRLPEAVREISSSPQIREDLLEMIDWADSYATQDVGSAPLSRAVPAGRDVLTFQDRFMAEGRNVLTGYDASEGALYVLFAAVLAVHPRAPQVLAIDNLDACLNPRLARALMERLARWVLDSPEDKQILLTSHNPLVLDGLPLQDDRVRLFTVDRSRKGRTVIRRVEIDEDLLAKARDGWTLSRLWVMGHLGGMPDL